MRIDWQRLAIMLRRHYKAGWQIDAELGLYRGYVNKLACGELRGDPKFIDGLRLLDLAHDHLPAEEFLKVRQ